MIRMPSPGPGNGCRQTISAGSPSCSPDQPDLVLEQRAQRLDELELEVVGQPADVVVGLDVRRAGTAAGLHDVGVERALDQELDPVPLRRGVADDLDLRGLEDPDELAADHLALRLGVDHPGERVEEALLGVHDVQGDARSRRRSRARPARPRPCGAARGRRRHRSAGRRSRAGRARRRRPSRRRRRARRSRDGRRSAARIFSISSSTMLTIVQVGRQPAMSSRKWLSTSWPCSVCITSGCHWTPASRRSRSSKAATGVSAVEASTSKPAGAATTAVAVAHPDPVPARAGPASSVPASLHIDGGAAVLRATGAPYLAAQVEGHRLEAVAHAEHRDPGREDVGVDVGRARRRRPRRARRTG